MPGLLDDKDKSKINPMLYVLQGETQSKSLDKSLADKCSRVLLADIPSEHLAGHTRLKKILRSTLSGVAEWPSAYNFSSEVISISVPLKVHFAFTGMTKKSADKIWALLFGNFWSRDNTQQSQMTDLLFPWIIRHELGHSMDKLIQFTNRFAGHPTFGGWVGYRSSTAGRLSLLKDVLTGLGSAFDTKKGAGKAAAEALAVVMGTPAKLKSKSLVGDLKSSFDEKKYTLTQKEWSDLSLAIKVLVEGVSSPWQRANSNDIGAIDGRVYSYYEPYGAWYSFSLESHKQRVSNYMFAAPEEWFAEYYAARYSDTTGQQMRATLDKYMSSEVIAAMDRVFAAQIDPRTGAVASFHWGSSGQGLGKTVNSLNERQLTLATESEMVHSARSDGSYYLGNCQTCMQERLGLDERRTQLAYVLPGMCKECSERYETIPLHRLQLLKLCDTCSDKFKKDNMLTHRFKRLGETLSKKVDLCPDRRKESHVRPGFEEGAYFLPDSWYRNNHIKDLTLEQICPGMLRRRKAFIASK